MLLQGGYHYIVPLHNSWGYIQRHAMPQEYNNTSYMRTHPTTNATQTETQTISTLLAQTADQEPIPQSKNKQKKNSKTSKHRSHIMNIATCTCNCCCSNL